MKDGSKVDIRFAMCFPDVYEIGMSHLGIQILYDMLNRREDVYCERVYSPWTDLDQIMREEYIPLFALESQDPIKGFDFLGITIQYEMCYANILQILDLSGIPLKAGDRDETVPIVIGGGPCTYNPEPLADFFDLFYIGEERPCITSCWISTRSAGRLERAGRNFCAQLPGCRGFMCLLCMRFPIMRDGTIASFVPKYKDVPAQIEKQIVMEVTDTYYPKAPVVPFIKATQDRVVLEIQRAASADAVSVRLECCIGPPGKGRFPCLRSMPLKC